MSTPILLASNNPHKLLEFRHLLGDDFEVVTPAELGLILDVEETGQTFQENAVLKAEAGVGLAGTWAVADDSGLEIDALDGQPGVLSARYGGPGMDDAGRVALVLQRLCGIPRERRTARFTCAIAVASPHCVTRVVQAVVEGRITEQPRGEGSFGYDPIFMYPPSGKTFAEMEAMEKGRVSHRGLALTKARHLFTEMR